MRLIPRRKERPVRTPGEEVAHSERWVRRLLSTLAVLTIALLAWLLWIAFGLENLAQSTAQTTQHTNKVTQDIDHQVLDIVRDDEAHIKALTAQAAMLTATVQARSAYEAQLEAKLVQVQGELLATDAELYRLGYKPPSNTSNTYYVTSPSPAPSRRSSPPPTSSPAPPTTTCPTIPTGRCRP